MDLLKELGIDRNTIVMFSSDNGPHYEGGADPRFFKSAGPLKGAKRSLHEGGIRVPFIVRQPGKVRAGTTSDHPSAFWDVMPTLCELMKVDAPEDTDGISFLPTLYDRGQQKKHDYLYWQFRGAQMVRRGKWKLLGNNQLYDLEADIGERKNLAKQHPELVEELKLLYRDARK